MIRAAVERCVRWAAGIIADEVATRLRPALREAMVCPGCGWTGGRHDPHCPVRHGSLP